jgi:hypothetical protein
MKITNVVFSNIQKTLEDAEQRQFNRLEVFQWVLEKGLSWATQRENHENLGEQTTPPGIEIPREKVELPSGINWRDCIIVIVKDKKAPGGKGTGRRKKNELAKKFAGRPAREWVEAWKKVDQTNYPISTNNPRMCTKSGYMLLKTTDGLIVNYLP